MDTIIGETKEKIKEQTELLEFNPPKKNVNNHRDIKIFLSA